MYYVEQKYFDNGKTKSAILTESEAKARGYYDGYQIEGEKYDLYVDGFPTHEAAVKCRRETLQA